MEIPLKDFQRVVNFNTSTIYTDTWYDALKRLLDMVFAATVMVCLLPVFLVVYLLVWFDSDGPVLFVQERMGQHGRSFKIVKFRTMYLHAEELLQELLRANPALKAEYEVYHKLRNDPRVTRVGRILRKYSLDELPQFWNVLMGDMSLVGPRPYLHREQTKMNGAEQLILSVRPGLTGFWQVNARNSVGFQDRLEMDLYYIQQRSLWTDILLIVRTAGVVLLARA